MKILVVEDDLRISNFLQKGLREAGFYIGLASSGFETRNLMRAESWDLFIVDVMLPDMDGRHLVQNIRHKKIDKPVLILSALGEAEDKVKALDIGADDYLTKPFHFPELISRIKALKRRFDLQYERDQILECGDLKVNVDANTVERAGQEIILSAKEFRFLVFLIENKGRIVTRTEILKIVWGTNMDPFTNVVDVYVSYLRNKIDKNASVKLIKTIKNRGYILMADE